MTLVTSSCDHEYIAISDSKVQELLKFVTNEFLTIEAARFALGIGMTKVAEAKPMRTLKSATGQMNAEAKASDRTEQKKGNLEALYLMQAEICRVIGHPRRIHILDLLSKNERTATQLRSSLGIGKVNLSQHLSLLKQAGLIRSRQRGRQSLYCIAIPEVIDACELVRKVLAIRLQQGTRLAKSLEASRSKMVMETHSGAI